MRGLVGGVRASIDVPISPDSQHPHSKLIERLIEKGVIQSPPLANFKNINNVEGQEYLINKRDSYINEKTKPN